MKKYLMTGIAAIALVAAFTSCSKSTDLYDEGAVKEREQQQEQQKVENNIELAKAQYAAAFEKAFGKVGSNVDWGFSSKASTRAECNKQAHDWVKLGYNVPVELSPKQIERVKAYFQNKKLTAGGSKDWTDFFVQQVYKGGTDPKVTKEDPKGFSPEEYHCANDSWVTAGSQMDYLTSNGDDHIFDFNSGDCSEIGNVESNPGVTYLNDNGNNTHRDKIRLMLGSKAENFGYHNSNADKTYNDHYVMVDGTDIDEWAKNNGNVGASVSGRFFVGFDFEQFFKEEDVYTGSWEYDGKTYKYVVNAPNKYCGYIENFNDDTKPTKAGTVAQWLADGYLPVSGNDKQWAKVEQCADGYFSDWIVSIAPAKSLYRVIAEDLNAEESTDFDFNDVVFDVVKAENGKTTLKLIAAGGIYKLTVAGVEVHEKLGENVKTDGTYPMINTGAGSTKEPVEFDIDGTYTTPEQIKNIVIKVFKPNTGDDGIELEATTGKPACKILVDDTFGIIPERHGVADEHTNFHKYVQGTWDSQTKGFWWQKSE